MTTLIIPTRDGESFSGYLAMPAKTPAPAVVVIQEIFGVNADMRVKCDELAELGFMALCPDLFWRLEEGVELTDKTEAEWEKAFDLYNRFDVEQGVADLRGAVHLLKGHAEGNGKVGCVGYCLGGKMAALMAVRSSVDSTVGYYGVGLEEMLEELQKVHAPVLLHMAEEDKFVSKEAQEQIKSWLADHALMTIHSYPGVNHAFARKEGEHYDEEAATLADARTLDFLNAHLGQALAA